MTDPIQISCPVPFSRYPRVVLAHGAGGHVMQRLIQELFLRRFSSPELNSGHDGAVVDIGGPIAVTTDAFVVKPLFFPGGDIGSLAVHGTVNDLAMCGAVPRYLTASFILEEGLELTQLERVVDSMAHAATSAGARIVAGDTKVVERGKGDGLFVSMTGVGEVIAQAPVGPQQVRVGDAVLVSGPIGDHGIAIMVARGEGQLALSLESDSAPVVGEVRGLLEAGVSVHCLRDLTRGGLASALNEIAVAARVGVDIEDRAIPVREQVADACEILGFDPTYVACEGRFAAFVPEADVTEALAVLRALGGAPARVGCVTADHVGVVVRQNAVGTSHPLDMLSGEQLPRIC